MVVPVVPAIGRACDTNDWVMNAIGAGAGVLLALVTIAVANRVAVGLPDDRAA